LLCLSITLLACLATPGFSIGVDNLYLSEMLSEIKSEAGDFKSWLAFTGEFACCRSIRRDSLDELPLGFNNSCSLSFVSIFLNKND
jgi:hypothetical protein